MKTCTKCGETKPLDDFHRNQSGADGRRSRCRECTAEYRRRYREENLDKVMEYQRRWREENRDKVLDYRRRYQEENRDKELERMRRWREENRDYRRSLNRANQSESQAMSVEMATVPLRTPWTEEEDAFLMADNGMTVFQKAIHLGRTYASCMRRRDRLRQAVPA